MDDEKAPHCNFCGVPHFGDGAEDCIDALKVENAQLKLQDIRDQRDKALAEVEQLKKELTTPLVVVVDPSVVNLDDLIRHSGPLSGLPIVRKRMNAWKMGPPLQILTRHGLQVLDPETLEPHDVENATATQEENP